jgi:hypothetical protein
MLADRTEPLDRNAGILEIERDIITGDFGRRHHSKAGGADLDT